MIIVVGRAAGGVACPVAKNSAGWAVVAVPAPSLRLREPAVGTGSPVVCRRLRSTSVALGEAFSELQFPTAGGAQTLAGWTGTVVVAAPVHPYH